MAPNANSDRSGLTPSLALNTSIQPRLKCAGTGWAAAEPTNSISDLLVVHPPPGRRAPRERPGTADQKARQA
jgi:hypothetical protein